jgi:DNA-binding transcriptional regulator YiaG
MTGRDKNGEWTRPMTDEEIDALTDEEIERAVADDPDAAPLHREGELEAMLAREVERDKYGVARLRRRLGMAQIVFADRYGLPYQALRAWERGEAEPDRAAWVLLAAIATDPELVARAAEHARDPEFLIAGPTARAA